MSFKIEDICEINSESIGKNDDYSFINYLDTGNLTEGAVEEIKRLEIGKDKIPSRAKRKVRKGDILISTVRPNQKHYGMVNGEIENLIVSTGFAVIRPNHKVDPVYLYKYLTLPNVVEYLQGIAETSTTTYPSIKPGVIGNIDIDFPPLNEQKAIANILLSLDEKIELNNQMNKTLEEMAQALFKRWFVDFEFPNEDGRPYKSSGGEMIDSEIGMIPKGWEIGVFREFAEGVLGGDWGKQDSTGNYNKEVYCLRGADIPEVKVGKKGNLPSRFILEKNHVNKKLSTGDLVVEISGGSPTQSTGRITYINKSMLNKFDLDIVCTNFCRAITLNNEIDMEFIYFYWEYLYNADIFFQYENGTTGIKNFDINTFLDKFDIVRPENSVIKKFHKVIKVLLNQVQQNGDESTRLAQIRDTLLPKLMSGEIRVADIQN